MYFKDLGLLPTILKAVEAEGYTQPTPIQLQAIPHVLDKKDVLACAQTGTGKTAAFALPILQRLTETKPAAPGEVRALILTPTRELASQIAQSFEVYGKGLNLRSTVVFGGVSQKPQVKTLRSGVDILIATPGRLLDLINQRAVRLNRIEIFVLDEADRMLDMGFIHDVRRIIQVIPKVRQTLFFSATMPADIKKLADQILNQPVRVQVNPVSSTVEMIQQSVFHVEKGKKTALLIHLLENKDVTRALVFTRTKRDANRVAESLNGARIRAEAIHGNKSQNARERALESIKQGQTRVLVATDIAARGIDIDQVTHVFNHDIPNVPESYVHRIGRTARAGTSGTAMSFCAPEERSFLADIERVIKKKITVTDTPEGLVRETKSQSPRASRPPSRGGGSRSGSRSGSGSGSSSGSRGGFGSAPRGGSGSSDSRSPRPSSTPPAPRRIPTSGNGSGPKKATSSFFSETGGAKFQVVSSRP
jgi:ATP-dependent RNA helicase RhlE